jgi:ppGpp synthetase/RelA/SpoT-type nucleotidyltranferase
MNPNQRSMFQPQPGESFSKSADDRAGRNLVQLKKTIQAEDSAVLEGVELDKTLAWFRAVEWWRALHSRPLSLVSNGLRYHVGKEAASVDGHVDVTQRLKRVPTIIDKLDREPKMKLTRMGDVGGVRVRLQDLDSVERVTRRLLKTWRTIERPHRDYIWGPPGPQDSGYRGVHLFLKKEGVRIEVQLRTVLQDSWANMVERVSRETNIDFKSGKGDPERLALFRLVADGLAYLDRGEPAPKELVEQLLEARDNESASSDR